jgi:hypothetical protein
MRSAYTKASALACWETARKPPAARYRFEFRASPTLERRVGLPVMSPAASSGISTSPTRSSDSVPLEKRFSVSVREVSQGCPRVHVLPRLGSNTVIRQKHAAPSKMSTIVIAPFVSAFARSYASTPLSVSKIEWRKASETTDRHLHPGLGRWLGLRTARYRLQKWPTVLLGAPSCGVPGASRPCAPGSNTVNCQRIAFDGGLGGRIASWPHIAGSINIGGLRSPRNSRSAAQACPLAVRRAHPTPLAVRRAHPTPYGMPTDPTAHSLRSLITNAEDTLHPLLQFAVAGD